MKKSGYLSKKSVGGKNYIYLRRSFRDGTRVKHKNLYAFGPAPIAIERMYWFRENPEQFPQKLIQEGFHLGDLDEWILTIETGITSTGRTFTLR